MILEKLKKRFPAEVTQAFEEKGEGVIVIRQDQSHEILRFLRDDPDLRFEFLMDLCGSDRSRLGETPRFEVVCHLYSLIHNHRLRVRVKIPEEDPRLASVVDLWRAADWMERECWEMFGIVFEGHPSLKHLLLFDGFEGYPLRKDYPIEKRQKIPVPEENLS